MEFKISGHLLTGFDIQMKHGPEQTGASAEEEGGRVNQIGFPSDEKNSSDIFTASTEGHWSNVGSMSWWEVIAVWKRLAFSPLLPWINCWNAAWDEQRRWDQSEDEWARSRHTKTNETHPAAFHFYCHTAHLVLPSVFCQKTEAPLVIAFTEEPKHKKERGS